MFMGPKYSVLYFKENLMQRKNQIMQFLREGIKVFWFGTPEDVKWLKTEFKPFADAFFLQAFSVEGKKGEDQFPQTVIIDGIGIDREYISLLRWLEEYIPAFNAAQYKVEHCREDENIVVKASAGTGKTTVMIDRILYLMHMVPDLKMSEIFMINFTNEATNQMNDRLQKMLLKKYALTKNQRYLAWLEQQSQMHISTIDSLAYDLFKRFGTDVGFGRDLSIKNLERDRKNLIKDLLSDELDEKQSITSQIGMTYSEAGKLIDTYWKELTQKGYTIKEILDKDWGSLNAGTPEADFQRVLKAVLKNFEKNTGSLN